MREGRAGSVAVVACSVTGGLLLLLFTGIPGGCGGEYAGDRRASFGDGGAVDAGVDALPDMDGGPGSDGGSDGGGSGSDGGSEGDSGPPDDGGPWEEGDTACLCPALPGEIVLANNCHLYADGPACSDLRCYIDQGPGVDPLERGCAFIEVPDPNETPLPEPVVSCACPLREGDIAIVLDTCNTAVPTPDDSNPDTLICPQAECDVDNSDPSQSGRRDCIVSTSIPWDPPPQPPIPANWECACPVAAEDIAENYCGSATDPFLCPIYGCYETAPAGGGGADGGTPDGGTPDGGTPDGGTPDGGTPDGGTPGTIFHFCEVREVL